MNTPNSPVTEPSDVKCGMVSILGRPNVGKSTLLNAVVGEKIAIVSRVPQTTRNTVRGIYHDERGQIIFIDTPGLHTGRDRLDDFMNQSAAVSMQDVDCLIHLVDVADHVGREEEQIISRLKDVSLPIILGLNKVDIKPQFISEYVDMWEQVAGRPMQELQNLMMVPLSGKNGLNITKLIDLIFERLPAGPPLYPADTVTDIPQRMAIADIIREKLFELMRQEIPHAIAVIIEDIQPRRRKVLHLQALILVEHESQKQIVIGHGGANLKQVGMQARKELEALLEQRVFLDLRVKTKRHWRENMSLLQEMGYQSL